MMTLTERQQQVLSFIQEFMEAEGFPPTRAEIADALGFRSANAAEDHLKALVRKGAVEILAGTSRGIRVLTDTQARGVPLVGEVEAGSPVLADENIESHHRLDPSLFRPKADYLLRVKGHAMRDVGILDGDLLAVHRTARAESGQVVVARLEKEITVRRFRRRGNVVRLMPENDKFSPVVLDLREDFLEIEGVGVGVIRNERDL